MNVIKPHCVLLATLVAAPAWGQDAPAPQAAAPAETAADETTADGTAAEETPAPETPGAEPTPADETTADGPATDEPAPAASPVEEPAPAAGPAPTEPEPAPAPEEDSASAGSWQDLVLPWVAVAAGVVAAAAGVGLGVYGAFPIVQHGFAQQQLLNLEGSGGDVEQAQQLQQEAYAHQKSWAAFGYPQMFGSAMLVAGGVLLVGTGATFGVLHLVQE